MDARNQLLDEKTKLLTKVAEFAQRGESREVLTAGQRLEKVETLIGRYERLVRDISDLDTNNSESQPVEDTRGASRLAREKYFRKLEGESGRSIGKTIRMDFLKKLSEVGVNLRHVRGIIYETKSGRKVGIAVATERKPDRCFLGLPLRGFDHAVLLCKRDPGDTFEICLPNSFFDEHGDHMSQSGDQIKFNVARRGNGYAVLVPGTDGVGVSNFPGAYSLLK